MASVINLNRVRKAKKRAASERRARRIAPPLAASKPERKLAERDRDHADRDLNSKRLE